MTALRKLLANGIVVFAAACFVCPAVDAQSASDSFAAGSAAFEDADYARALAFFEAARDAGSEGPAVHYNIAVCQYRLGNFGQAEAEFRMIADRFPRMRDLALYNVGLSLLRQDRDDEARGYFERVSQSSRGDNVGRLADIALRRIDGLERDVAPPARSWLSLVDVNLGHDDNVTLVDEATLRSGQSVDSRFTELTAVLMGPVRAEPGFRFDGSAYAIKYSDAGGYDQNVIRVGGAYWWRTGAWRMEAGPQVGYTTLDGDGFDRRYGASFTMRRALGSNGVLGFRVAHDEIEDASSRFAFIAGSREQASVTWDHYGASGRVTLGYYLELNDRRNAGVSPTRNRLVLNYRRSVNPRWTVDARFSLRQSTYDDLVASRREDLAEASAGFARRLAGRWEVTGRYQWSDNDASTDAFAYTRQRLTFGLTKSF